ncbi:MAG: hypothetical protein JSS28_03900 [Proteobacteria bacterium]|nr:hypothetical protein [Pseudomonadota bacterium]
MPTPIASHRRHAASLSLALATLGSAAAGMALSLPAAGVTPPSGCTSIQNVPPMYSGIQFGAAIEGIFTHFNDTNGCTDCHTTTMGSQLPAGGLDLDPQDDPSPYVNLINVPSALYSGYTYVVPNHPEQSLLFMKVACDNPGVGSRMPLTYAALTAEQIALIYDWIAEGAPAGTTDGIFRGTFDIRGFDQ